MPGDAWSFGSIADRTLTAKLHSLGRRVYLVLWSEAKAELSIKHQVYRVATDGAGPGF
jgi:hypothetical protein